jgi:hypothetical protein
MRLPGTGLCEVSSEYVNQAQAWRSGCLEIMRLTTLLFNDVIRANVLIPLRVPRLVRQNDLTPLPFKYSRGLHLKASKDMLQVSSTVEPLSTLQTDLSIPLPDRPSRPAAWQDSHYCLPSDETERER